MDFSQVKNLQIPEGSVLKITDSNGNILYNKTIYRQLEYIHFNGAEYIQTDFYPGTNPKNYQFEFTVDNKTDSMSLGCYYNVSTTDALRRWYILNINSNGIRCGLGNQWSGYTTADSWSTTDRLRVSATYNRQSNTPKLYWYLKNVTTNTDINTATPLSASTTGNIQTSVYLRIGCRTSTTSNGTVNEEYFKGKMFYFIKRDTNGSGTIERNLIPCQRKSDNLCGFYDTISQAFWPLQGTTVTDDAAGPTADENPNWSPIVIYGTFTATGGDESKGYSNTYSLPGGVGSWPVSVDTVTNIPDDVQYAYVSFKMHAGSLSGTQSGARNRFIVDGSTVQTSSAYQDGQAYKVDAMNRTITNKYYSLANSVTFAIIETREAATAEHPITFEYDKTNNKIKCTADAAQGSVQGGAKCWFSNIEIVIYR